MLGSEQKATGEGVRNLEVSEGRRSRGGDDDGWRKSSERTRERRFLQVCSGCWKQDATHEDESSGKAGRKRLVKLQVNRSQERVGREGSKKGAAGSRLTRRG
jgi:hypothetical protein